MPLDQEDGAGNLAGLRLIIEEVVDARELFRRQGCARPRAEVGGGQRRGKRGKDSDLSQQRQVTA
jgi:hypothetical protein